MKLSSILVASLFAATSSLVGCAYGDPSVDEGAEPVAEDAEALTVKAVKQDDEGYKLTAGHCSGDGFVVRDGRIYRLGTDIGPDLTGISIRDRASYGQAVCHNVSTWTPLVQYVCNANTAKGNKVDAKAGTYHGDVHSVSEWVNFNQTVYPAKQATQSLHFGFAVLSGRGNTAVFPNGDPCPLSAPADLPLTQIECCATAATP
jgi:hypothetical protein